MQPIITNPNASLTVTQGVAFSYTIVATQVFPGTQYLFSSLPNGVWSVEDPFNNQLNGYATTVGEFPIQITVINPEAFDFEFAVATLNLIVQQPVPEIFPSNPSSIAVEGNTFQFQVNATNNPTSFAAQGLPTGLTINTATGLISGKPSQIGNFTVTLTATNISGTSNPVKFSLVVNPAAPVVTGGAVTGKTGVQFTYQIKAVGVGITKYGANGLPAGLTVNTTTGIISGIPTTVGQKTVLLTATNITGTGTAILTINITQGPPVITTTSLPSGTEEQPYQFQMSATNSPTSWTASGLPNGLIINSVTGLISGSPSLFQADPANESSAKVFYVAVVAKNAAGSNTKYYTISVSEIWPKKGTLTGTSPAAVQLVGGYCTFACAYYENEIVSTTIFGEDASGFAFIKPQTVAVVNPNTICPWTIGNPQNFIIIPGKMVYHVYKMDFGTNYDPSNRSGKVIIPGRTWKQCDIGEGIYNVIGTFVPIKCWRDRGMLVTYSFPYRITICKGSRGDCKWPYTCPCGY